MPAKRLRRKTHFELIPMIDVMMILTLFLALMAFMPQAPHAVETELPGAKSGTEIPASLTVELGADGILHLQGKTVTVRELPEALAPELTKSPDLAVVLAADRRIAYEQVMLVLDTIKQAGVTRLSLAVDGEGGRSML